MRSLRVSVIGAGLMGHGLAMAFALGGHEVALHDVSSTALEKARSLIATGLETLAEAGWIGAAERSSILTERMTCTTDLVTAADAADLVIEAVTEDQEIKRSVFSELDRIARPDAIIASNTSYLNVFELLPPARQPRSLIAHWYTPPYIIDLVDLVPGPQTQPEIVATMKDLLERLGKKPIVLPRFISGFIANRLQAALTLEVFFLLDQGYATPEQIDTAIKAGLALRMPILGFLKKADYTGLEMIQRALANRTYYPPEVQSHSEVLDAHVKMGRTGVMAGKGFYDYRGRSPEALFRERDLKLLALKKFLAELGELD